jgi:predicted ArsR family transcriptional regulator
MNLTRLDARFFDSTRGRIIVLLKMSPRTVNEIAELLGLTDNAIRAHLLILERDGLVEQRGAVKGFRKPHTAYGLTDNARHLFPKPYAFVLNNLIEELKATVSRRSLLETLRRLGRRIAGTDAIPAGDLDERLAQTVKTLERLGGAASIVKEDGKLAIRSESCPFNEAVSEHPEVCQVAEAMITEIVGRPVREVCRRNGSPKCYFEIEAV